MGWFIKLYIKLLEWRWSDDPNMVSTLVHVFMLANTEDREWHGDIIPRGSFVTTRSKLAELVGISEQQMRTCLKRLADEKTIELNCTNKYTIVTICNYAIYQDNKNDVNQQITNKQPTNNQQITSNNNIEYKSNRDKESISKDIPKKDSELENEPKVAKIQTGLDFVAEEIRELFGEFLDMRKKTGNPLKTARGMTARYRELMNLSSGDMEKAKAIIRQTLDNEWARFYEIKQKSNNGSSRISNGEASCRREEDFSRREYTSTASEDWND